MSNFWLEYSFYSITDSPLDIAIIETLWDERHTLSEITTRFYLPTLLKTTALAIIATLILGWKPPQHFTIPSFMGIIPIGTLAIILNIPNFGGTYPPFSALLNLTTVIPETKYNGLREAIVYRGSLSPKIKNIIFIMDESVRGDYLTINNTLLDTTPYLELRKSDLISFGKAVSASNCSAASRYIVRTGLQPSQLPDMDQLGLKIPSMWQYAKRAGYRTVHIDAYARFKDVSLSNHHFMNSNEREAIDLNIPIITFPRYLRDPEIAEEILKALASKEPTFIFVEKSGAHYPYHKLYPPTYADAAGAFPNPNFADPEQLKRSYRLAIQWSVNDFFKKLLPKIDFSNTMLIYTSDHGQSLLEGGYKMMHCSTTGLIHPGEGNIPLFMITKNPDLEAIFQSASNTHLNRASHFQIFPTLLWLMGYENTFVDHFGMSLVSPSPVQEPWSFFTGYIFARQGHRWVQGQTN